MARTSIAGGLLLVIIGLPFLGFGGYMCCLTGSMLADWHAAKTWTETPATIERLELETHRGSKGSVSYKVNCEYAYAFAGRIYRGDRVGLASGFDSIGGWARRTHAGLKAARDEDGATSCYVDSARPDRALLDRDLRLELAAFMLTFCTIFSSIGAGMLAGGVYSLKSGGGGKNLRANHPSQPWMWRKDWAEGRIPSGTRLKVVCLWFVAVVWNATSAPVVLIVVPEAVVSQGQTWALALLGFPLLGVVMLIWAVYATTQHLKFGRSYLQLRTLPGAVGGQFCGDLVLAGDVGNVQMVNFSLRCVHSVTTGAGKQRYTTRTTVWESEKPSPPKSGFNYGEVSVPAEFDIPETAPPTDTSNAADRFDWKLRAAAEVPGVNLKLEFDVPVFRVMENTAAPESAIVSDQV